MADRESYNRIRKLEAGMRRLMAAVQEFGEARYLDDDEEMNRSGPKVDAAMAECAALCRRGMSPSGNREKVTNG